MKIDILGGNVEEGVVMIVAPSRQQAENWLNANYPQPDGDWVWQWDGADQGTWGEGIEGHWFSEVEA